MPAPCPASLLLHAARRRLAGMAIVLCAAVGAAAATDDLKPAQADPPTVEVRGDTVYYTGGFQRASLPVFDAAVAGLRRGQVTRIVVRSGGGDTVAGRHVGRWVRDMALVVEVDQICFSACADYVFPAGRARVIRAGAFVGWHGNERQMQILAVRRGTTPMQEFIRLLPPGLMLRDPAQARAQATQAADALARTLPDEQAFYRSLGLSDAFAVCAVGESLGPEATAATQGWGFSVADMVRLGLANTVYLGDGVYERDSALFRKHLVRITADACLALMQ